MAPCKANKRAKVEMVPANGKESPFGSAKDRILRLPIDLHARESSAEGIPRVKFSTIHVGEYILVARWKIRRFSIARRVASHRIVVIGERNRTALASEKERACVNDPDARCHCPRGKGHGETRTKRATETRCRGAGRPGERLVSTLEYPLERAGWAN